MLEIAAQENGVTLPESRKVKQQTRAAREAARALKYALKRNDRARKRFVSKYSGLESWKERDMLKMLSPSYPTQKVLHEATPTSHDDVNYFFLGDGIMITANRDGMSGDVCAIRMVDEKNKTSGRINTNLDIHVLDSNAAIDLANGFYGPVTFFNTRELAPLADALAYMAPVPTDKIGEDYQALRADALAAPTPEGVDTGAVRSLMHDLHARHQEHVALARAA